MSNVEGKALLSLRDSTFVRYSMFFHPLCHRPVRSTTPLPSPPLFLESSVMRQLSLPILFAWTILSTTPAVAADGNRLTYLDESDPYYVGRTFPKLVTPQWVGEQGVEAVVILAIDDMRGHEKWEAFLRPILNRLKRIDGRAPVSIMTNQIDPKDPHLQLWLKEGLSLETHTIDHPCPFFQRGDFAKAKSTYDHCVDLMTAVPNNRPVAFRMPCCDSLNTPSPRFYAEIFNKTTPKGNWLSIDSSVFNLFTSNDPKLPHELVIDADGQDKFRKYLPSDRSFVNTIEDYPYPYVIGRLCWEFPCVTPSDWQAHHYHGSNNPRTVRDWKAALDATVLKQGVFTMVFHPHGWIKNEHIVDLIDYAVAKYGKKVKFLTFREALDRLNKNLLGGQTLRGPNGEDNGVRLIDVNNDGFLDVVIGNDKLLQTRIWSPESKSWIEGDFPVRIVETNAGGRRKRETGVQFGVLHSDGQACFLIRNEEQAGAWQFDGKKWNSNIDLLAGLELDGQPVPTNLEGRDQGVRFRDLDKDGRCELIVSNDQQQAIFGWSADKKKWTKLPFALPSAARIVDEDGKDNGVRFVDFDEDGREDVIWSNENGSSLHLFSTMQTGWSKEVARGQQRLPMIVQKGTNNGVWFHSHHLWVQNENTALLKDHVDRRSVNQLLTNVEPTAKSPEASLHSWHPRPGFEVELMAAEPLVESPIAFAWGPDGKFWVVEMRDYPNGLDGKGQPGGRIKFLEDTKGTGKYDKATIFLDNLAFPTSVMPWRKGVIVTCAPEIFYAEDTDGDGNADLRVPLFTGFTEGNPQHRANSLVWGLDNWIYGANGDSGGAVKSAKTGKAVAVSGRDYRFRPDDGSFETQTGQTQYGRCRDDWGNWFGCNNSDPMYHFVLDDHYLRRNPHVPAPNPRAQVSVTPGAAPVFPASRTLPRFNDPWAANRFTSACSVIVYRDDLFGPAFANNSFVSEPVHDLVHREIMSPKGVTFSSRRAVDEQQSEFLASSDNWTRPTTIQTGPDGALWVADMYRHVIEHPEWIPEEWQKRLDLRAGQDKGRIYRVYPVGKKPRPIPRLDKLSTAQLVAALDSPNGWQRDLAQQLLIQRADLDAVPLLEKQAATSQRPLCRLHSLCTLDGLNSLRPVVLEEALRDADPGVRRHAVRLGEARLKESPELGAALVRLTDDLDPHVRMQVAYSLGEWNDPRAGEALGRLAMKDGNDPYLLAAIMSSVNEKNLDQVIPALSAKDKNLSVPKALTENFLRMAIALSHSRGLTVLLGEVGKRDGDRYASWQFASLAGVLDALELLNSSLLKLAKAGDANLSRAVMDLNGLFAAARVIVADPKAPRDDQLQAVRLLGRGPDHRQKDIQQLASLLSPQTADDLQNAAVTALGRIQDPAIPETLLKGWKAHSPALRGQVLDILSRREEWVKVVLDAIEKKQILSFEVDAPRRQKLLQHRNAKVRERAGQLFASAVNPDRQKVVDTYRPSLALKGDAVKGKEIFKKTCATCHRHEGLGQQVGPDIASVGDKSPESLLVAILDPNRAVEARYISYLATLKNGITYTGVLSNETGTSITLIGTEGKPQTILRKDLDELASTGKSLMPEGLEKEIPPDHLPDLIAFLRAGVPEPKRKTVEGNRPELVSALGDGTLRLYPSNCEIYGSEITLEKEHANLGWWTSPEDRAVWAVLISKPGKFAVRLEWACADESAGNSYLLQIGESKLSGTVPATGSWDNYQRAKIGEVTLPAGKHQAVFRSAGKIKGALIDLKEVRLTPINQ
jgi:putative membrane-bound dehydrogenase-like protein